MSTRTSGSGCWTAWSPTALALLACSNLLGCSTTKSPLGRIGDSFEALCIKGQLSATQAATLFPEQYKTHPSYCLGRENSDGDNGDSWCQAEEGDRILAAHCSRALRELAEGR